MKRFQGLCEPICEVDVRYLTDWITQIPFEEWPQQTRLADGQIRPAMVSDLNWYSFGKRTELLCVEIGINAVTALGHGEVQGYNRLLSVVMPGHSIAEHHDQQPEDWLARVHVPLTTNPYAYYFARHEGEEEELEASQMEVGTAYLINTLVNHSIENHGDTPRIHLMFDIKRQ